MDKTRTHINSFDNSEKKGSRRRTSERVEIHSRSTRDVPTRDASARGKSARSTSTRGTSARNTSARSTSVRDSSPRSVSAASRRDEPKQTRESIRSRSRSPIKREASSTRANAEKRRLMEKKDRRHEWLEALFEAGIITLVLFFILWPTQISGESMQDTFFNGDRVVMSRVMVYLKLLHRNDIVICRASEQTNNKSIIKRVIGVPGDRITISDGKVYLNNVLLHEEHIGDNSTLGEIDRMLEKDEYFVMGDNRSVSLDSRSFGPIEKRDIIGKVVFRYYPLSKLRLY